MHMFDVKMLLNIQCVRTCAYVYTHTHVCGGGEETLSRE